MNTTNRAARLLRRLTVGSTAGALAAAGLFGGIAATTIPGTSDASAQSGSSTSSTSPTSSTPDTPGATTSAAGSGLQAAGQVPTTSSSAGHATSGGS